MTAFCCAAQAQPVVVELFTSQSCSSCPPADKLLNEIANRKDIIALSCHVTYWNELDWRDTLSQQGCTQRQYDYAERLEQGRAYTPNMVVNGRNSFVGSNRSSLNEAIKQAQREYPLSTIGITAGKNGVTAAFPKRTGTSGPYRVILFTYKPDQTVAIASGENDGAVITYAHAVTHIETLKDWDGTAGTRSLPLALDDKGQGVVVIAQSAPDGPIIAAGELRYHMH